jgi:hypothetical protein
MSASISDKCEIAHKLSALTNAVIQLEQNEEENDDAVLSATRILKANLEWVKEVAKYEASELKEILQIMADQQHEYAVEFLCERLGIHEYGLIKDHPDHSFFTFNRKW